MRGPMTHSPLATPPLGTYMRLSMSDSTCLSQSEPRQLVRDPGLEPGQLAIIMSRSWCTRPRSCGTWISYRPMYRCGDP